jgi:hypothetical protein
MRDFPNYLEPDAENRRRNVRNTTLILEVEAVLIDSIEVAPMVPSTEYLAVTGDARLLGLLERRTRRWVD